MRHARYFRSNGSIVHYKSLSIAGERVEVTDSHIVAIATTFQRAERLLEDAIENLEA